MTSARYLFATALLIVATSARAQGYLASPYEHRPFLLYVSWELAAPMLDLRSSFVDATSTTGVDLGIRYELQTQLSLGVEASWNRFEQSSTIGDRFAMDAVTIRGTLHYYFTPTAFQPYAGLGVGGVYREAIVNSGPTQAGWGLCGGPEIGVLLTFQQGLALNVGARFEVTTASFDVNGNQNWHVGYPSWIALQVGLAMY